MGSCISKCSSVPNSPATNSVNSLSPQGELRGGGSISSSASSSGRFEGLKPAPKQSQAPRSSKRRLAGEIENTLFFGRQETQEELLLWAHDGDPASMTHNLQNIPITVRQFLGGHPSFDPEERCPELNQQFADYLRSNPKWASAVNDQNRENFSDETPDMSRALSMIGDPVALAGRSSREVAEQAALNETNVFKKKSKGALSFAVETGRDVAFGLNGRSEMSSAPAKNPFYKHGYYAGTSVTDAELRHIYRNREDPGYQQRVQFYSQVHHGIESPTRNHLEFEQCAPPWEQEPQIWQNYMPKAED
ncbi:hypothetical protein ACCQ13_02065 [Xanthomonas sp. NCPPB 1638]|nr:hypothetical protein [Xanthomonas cucurbitae]WDM75845.1 hypothetical protein K6982_02045 [Xanthomonas cucurbitae]WDM83243.1 hypothetical protein K6979_02060 [Xanthomonas cucurbitae]